MTAYLSMALGGVLGVLARYFVGGAVYRALGWGPPWGTFLVNATGCFAIGFISIWVEFKGGLTPALRAFLLVGFLGAYTTFSTYMFESFTLIDQKRIWLGLGNLVASVVVGFLALWVGVGLGKILMTKIME